MGLKSHKFYNLKKNNITFVKMNIKMFYVAR